MCHSISILHIGGILYLQDGKTLLERVSSGKSCFSYVAHNNIPYVGKQKDPRNLLRTRQGMYQWNIHVEINSSASYSAPSGDWLCLLRDRDLLSHEMNEWIIMDFSLRSFTLCIFGVLLYNINRDILRWWYCALQFSFSDVCLTIKKLLLLSKACSNLGYMYFHKGVVLSLIKNSSN